MKKIILSLGAILILSNLSAQTPNFNWSASLGGSGSETSEGIVLDNNGNVYTTGQFGGTADFNPSASASNLTSQGLQDIYVSKLNSSGGFVWAKSIGGSSLDFGEAITLDASNNVYVIGRFTGTVDFDPGTNVSSLTASTAAQSLFILKLDANGNYVWAKTVGGTVGNATGADIKINSLGEVIVVGTFFETIDFDPGAGTENVTATSSGTYDAFVLKLNSAGDFQYVKKLGSTGADIARSLTIDNADNIIVGGDFTGTSDYDPGSGTSTLTPVGGTDGFICKLDNGGNLIWSISIGGTSEESLTAITSDVTGNVFVTGYYSSTCDFDPTASSQNLTSAGDIDVFAAKYTQNGQLSWVKSFGGTSTDLGHGITVDNNGDTYIVGYITGTADFNTGSGSNTFTSQGNTDGFLAKLNSNGNYVWAGIIGGPTADASVSIFVDNANSIYTTGYFSGTADLDPTSGTSNESAFGGAALNSYVNKLSPSTSSIDEASLHSFITVYPNPSNGQIHFTSNSDYRLVNLSGQIIETGLNKTSLNLSGLMNGIYLLEFIVENKIVQIERIIKN